VVEEVDEEMDATVVVVPVQVIDLTCDYLVGLALGIYTLDSPRYLGAHRVHTSAPGAR